MYKSIVLIICFVLSTMSVTAQKKKKVYYSLGATEEQVLRIQGQPTSMSTTGSFTTYHYGYSYLSFTDGYLTSYDNSNRNLRIKIKPTYQQNKTVKSSGVTMYAYFIYLTDNLYGPSPISELFTINNYTYKMLDSFEFCLTKEYKQNYGGNATVIQVLKSNRSEILNKWNEEKGSITNTSIFCMHGFFDISK